MSTTPTNPIVEMQVDGKWIDITNDVRLDSADSGGGIQIKRGRPNESPAAEPTEVSFVLNNGVSKVAETEGISGVYNLYNPASPWYGKLNRNQPMRIGWNRVWDEFDRSANTGTFTDDFDRTAASSWGNGWTTSGGSSSDFSVSGGLGRMSLGTLNVGRRVTQAGNRPSGTMSVTIGISSLPSGDDIETSFMMYYQDTSNYMQCSFYWDREGRPIELRVVRRLAGVATTLDTVELGFNPSEAGLRIKAKCEWHGGMFRLRAWKTTDEEPDVWYCGGYDTTWSTGLIGLRANLQPSYTGTVPQVVTWDDFSVSDLVTENDWWGRTPSWTDRELIEHEGHPWNLNGNALNFDMTGGFGSIQAATGFQSATFGVYADVDIRTRFRVTNRTSEFGIILRQDGIQPEDQPDGQFEGELGPWQVFGGTSTLVQSTAQARFGTGSALMTAQGGSSNTYMRPVEAAPVVEGESYKVRCWVRASYTGDMYLSWDWFDDDFNYVDSSYSGGIAVTADNWFVLEFTATCPAGATQGTYGPGFDFAPANGTFAYIDNLHYQHTSSILSYWAYIHCDTEDSVRLSRGSFVATQAPLGQQIVPGVNYLLHAQINGPRLRIKCWRDGDDEPTEWMRNHVDTNAPNIVTRPGLYGEVGLFAYEGTARVEFDYIRVDQWRAHAEITALPTRHDLGRFDHWVPVEARGIRRRLGQGRKALASAVTRHLSQYAPIGMWLQLESGVASDRVPNAAPGAPQGFVRGISFQTPDSTGEHALPGVAGYAHLDDATSYVSAIVPYMGQTGRETILCFFRLDSNPASDTQILNYQFTGHGQQWRCFLQSDGVMRIEVRGMDGTLIDSDIGPLWNFTGVPIGSWIACTLYVQQVGANTVWAWNYHRPGSDAGFFTINSSFVGVMGRFRQFRATSYAAAEAAGGLSISHVFHYMGDLPFVTSQFARAAAAYDGESSIDRFNRLTTEVGIRSGQYNPSGGVSLGPQLPLPLLDLLDECGEVEHGAVLEDRDEFALDLYTRPMAYRARPFEVDIDAGHLTSPLEPSPDDQGTRNDVTVRHPSGFFAVSVQTEGPLNVNQPEDDVDGVGIYDEAPELNFGDVNDLQKAANWRRSRGTVPEPRYPGISIDLTSSAYQADPGLAATAAAIDTGRMLHVVNAEVRPEPVPVLVQSYSEFIDQYDWDITWVGTPGRVENEIGTTSYSTRVSPSNATTQASFISGTNTALMSQGTLWATTAEDAGVTGFDIMVSGVRLRVVSISGTSAPQTITVEQTPVNGVIKTIPVGSKIELYQPWRVAW